jgi:predicted signal transduction protein with EAL and GGDEF domain
VTADPKTDASITVTVSIGVAVLGRHGSDLFELLAAADLALYRAKDAGRNQVRLCASRQQPRITPPDPRITPPDHEGDEASGACP